MKIFLTILLVLAGLILFVLFCPFSIQLAYDNEVTLKVGYLFPFFRILPQKPKPEKKEDTKPQESSVASPTKKKAKTAKKKNPVWEFTKKQGLEGIIELLKQITGIVMKLLDTVRKHLVISRLRLDLLVVGEDPADTAMKYGYACAAIYPLLSLLDRHVRIRKHEEYIDAGFEADTTKVHFIMKVHIMPIFVVAAALGALFKGIGILQKLKQ